MSGTEVGGAAVDGAEVGGAVPLSLVDFRRLAAAALPRDVWDFVAGGSGEELTLAANREALDRLYLIPRVLRDVESRSAEATLLGNPAALPLAVAPVAYHRLLHPEGELATARAAKAAGVPFTAGMLSSFTVEQIAATGADTWFQLYWLRDRELRWELVRRAERAGCAALVLTVDVPWMGRRLRDVRNGFALPPDVVAANLVETIAPTAAHRRKTGSSAVAAHTALAFAPTLSWDDVEELRAGTRLPLVLKGVLAAEDAARAADAGVDAVVVSNHGGRQLDGALPSIAALPAVRDAVAGRCQVLLDSGVRSGLDMLKALALGADGVLVGRPLLWGLAVDGEQGVRQVLDLLATEFDDALGLAGCRSLGEVAELRTVQRP